MNRSESGIEINWDELYRLCKTRERFALGPFSECIVYAIDCYSDYPDYFFCGVREFVRRARSLRMRLEIHAEFGAVMKFDLPCVAIHGAPKESGLFIEQSTEKKEIEAPPIKRLPWRA